MRFTDLFEVIRNGRNVRQTRDGRGFAVSRIETISSGSVDMERVGRTIDRVDPAYFVERGDILFSHINSPEHVGRVAMYEGPGGELVHGINLLLLRCRRNLANPRFALHLLRSPGFRTSLRPFINKAVNQASISITNLKCIELDIPPIDEQRQIAAVLDHADQLRAKRQASIALLDSLNESVFLDMFGDHSTWAQAEQPLIELVDPDRPISYGILKPGPEIGSGVPYVRVLDMRLGGVDPNSVKRTSPEISHQYRRSLLRTGDLLLSIRGHVGRLAEVPPELDGANITQDTARLAIKQANPRFVLQYLRSSWAQRWMESNIKGAAVRGINLGDVKRLPVPVFESSAQNEFVRRVRSAEKTATAQQRSAGGLDELFLSLQHRAFSGTL